MSQVESGGGLDLADGLRLLHGTHDEGHFGHHSHLCFGWAVLDEAQDVDDAAHCVSLTIRHVAELGGTPDKYHETVTIFWVRLLDHLRHVYPGATSVDQMGEVYPDLLDAELPDRYWSDLDGEAKVTWVEPDLQPMP